ncbi:MAG TPA: T9SS type A sorting domain-containing protein [Tenuifilaceae bacterium]|nr:T9SS type A sorting domain-containing protein [Bacteroidales bacterium]MDI9515421.1 T9SS type A sorting domain-containing protein [Bacteroidota bacterium]NLH57632.1 T9SS type A sorting domain-containing protein [Rikenellaceae bacterium]OQC63080.1 MAG: hypothetical protein BWX49_01403 [Bacteroidetes bacterium ADurb.Bin008]HNV82363.1 T9SS type A sorting domain-containing protein [Tenuifilaceae bacterium]
MKRFGLALFISLLPFLSMAQWSDDPMVNTQITNLTGEQVLPKIAVCPNGDYFIGFFSLVGENYNVRLQRLDSAGNTMWDDNGILISAHPSMTWLTDWDMAADNENHAVITFQDIRLGGNNNTVAYRISPEGEFVWGPDGIMLSNSDAFNVSPVVTVTQANNAVFAWAADGVIILQKINPAGEKQWGEWGITLSCENSYSWPQLMPAGEDDVLMKFFEDSGVPWAPTRHILAQRFNSSGEAVWENNTIISDVGAMSAWTQILSFVSDGEDGFYIAWHDNALSSAVASAWIQHVNAQGEVQFQVNGVQLSLNELSNHFEPKIITYGDDPNVYVYWNEVNADQNKWGIYGQKVTPEGNISWCGDGKIIFPLSQKYINLQFAIPHEKNTFLIFWDGISTVEFHYRVARLNSEGLFVWDESALPISTAPSDKLHPAIADFSNNQWVLTWEDKRTGSTEVFAQNFRPDGSLGNTIAEGSISGTVSIEGDMADVTEVTITIGELTTNPDANGHYGITLQPGTYSVTASHPYTEEVVIEGVAVVSDEVTANVDFSLPMLRRDVVCHAINQIDLYIEGIELSVAGPEGTYTGVTGAEPFVIPNAPYGLYHGTAIYNADEVITVECDTLIDAGNGDLVFRFTTVGNKPEMLPVDLKIYPNPVIDESVLELNLQMAGIFQISLISETGEVVASKSNLHLSQGYNSYRLSGLFPLKNLPSGVYLIRIANAKQKAAIRFSKVQ